ncbi:NUDIX domain-containing protein [Cellulophaga sp. E6(2014)]|jgi:isopentenyldiphosphate isomerase|uniref:NUDIX hydrolase n=1 Tax=Cellulophaga sp. E6(2014) TaxID=1495334 RepID=UPI00051D82C9|nr:NUDIX domain-containing protein [Cellulophaga sp. E6(2014)]KGK30301.1 hydrolase [Cellulophaga sp. E6(2014)]
MDELIDIVTDNGLKTGETVLKSVAHRDGIFHQTVHIWFYTKNHQILLQQRGKDKNTFPLLLDVSVAGHIHAGEAIEVAALREIEEEIGLLVSKKDLKKIGVFKSIQNHHPELIDAEFHHTFIAELKVPLQELIKQESEVEDLQLTSLIKFSEETWGMANSKKYVPHSATYYKTVIKAIKKEL